MRPQNSIFGSKYDCTVLGNDLQSLLHISIEDYSNFDFAG